MKLLFLQNKKIKLILNMQHVILKIKSFFKNSFFVFSLSFLFYFLSIFFSFSLYIYIYLNVRLELIVYSHLLLWFMRDSGHYIKLDKLDINQKQSNKKKRRIKNKEKVRT